MMGPRVICLSIAASISDLLLVGCGSPSADVTSTPSPAATSTETVAPASPISDAATLKPTLQKAIALKFDGQKYSLNPSDQAPLPANAIPKGTILFPAGTQPETLAKPAT